MEETVSLVDGLIEEGLTNPVPVLSGTPKVARRAVYINLRNDLVDGEGTPDNPYNGSNPTTLDRILSQVIGAVDSLTIKFGPGIFQTFGFGAGVATVGWTVRPGFRIVGSGMYQTVLQLVGVKPTSTTVAAAAGPISSDLYVDWFELSNLTLDSNCLRQPLDSSGKPGVLTVSGIGLTTAACNNVLVRRVRLINWGPHTPQKINSVVQPSWECFPIALFGGSGASSKGYIVVENCIVEQPTLWPARESTLINSRGSAGWSSSNPTGVPAWWNEVFSTVRNCYLNCDFTTGSSPPAEEVVSATHTSGEVILRTRWPHRIQGSSDGAGNSYLPDKIIVSGAGDSSLNGRWTVVQALDDFRLKFSKTGSSANPWALGMKVRRHVPEAMVASSVVVSGTTVTVTTAKAHLRLQDDYVRISGVVVNSTPTGGNNRFNGCFKVTSASEFQLTYEVETGSDQPAGVIWLDRWPSKKVGLQSAVATANVGEIVIETKDSHYRAPGDYIMVLGISAGASTDYWNGWFKVLESNDYSRTKFRCLTNYTGGTLPGSPNVTFAETYNQFQGLSTQGTYGPIATGNRIIGAAVGGPYHDTYQVQDSIAWDSYYYKCFVGVRDLAGAQLVRGHLIERTVFEMETHVYSRTDIHPAAISLEGTGTAPIIQNAIVRKNIVRFADGGNSPGSQRYEAGVLVDSGQNIIVHNNIVNLPDSHIPVRFRDCPSKDGMTFNNLEMYGTLVRGLHGATPTSAGAFYQQELQDYADDLFLFLK